VNRTDAKSSRPAIRSRVEQEAAAGGVAAGEFIAGRVRHLLDHGGEDVWLNLVAAMSDAPQVGTAALDRILARAFSDPMRVRITLGRATLSGSPRSGHPWHS
jgi:hypothetical protein